MAKKKIKIKVGARALCHMSKEWSPKRWEDLLLLDPTDERIQQMKERGFVVLGQYQLVRMTGGRVDMALPNGVFACASSPLVKSPWLDTNEGEENE